MDRFIRYHVFFILCLFFCFHCASEGLPGGGPPDKEPPQLVKAIPLSGSVGIDSLQALEFVFSEALNTPVVEKNISLFPMGATEIQIRARGKNIHIRPRSPWKKNTVYTLILGKNISDLRNNAMTAPIHISFTRDAEIPENSLRGRVVGLQEGLLAGVYISRRHSNPDSILAFPEYYSQAAEDGSFSFRYLPQEKFYIAGYVDLDKSNTYQEKRDGRLVPDQNVALPDTEHSPQLSLLAVHDNYLPPRLIKTESLYSSATKLQFSKKLDSYNNDNVFSIQKTKIDTLIIDDKFCTLYHEKIERDSLFLEIRGLRDHLQCIMPDSSLKIKVKALADTLYNFSQEGNILFVKPPPGTAKLSGNFESPQDSMILELKQIQHGMYRIPESETDKSGEFLVKIPRQAEYPEMHTDSLYRVPLRMLGKKDFGTVSGKIAGLPADYYRVVLESADQRYELPCPESAFHFQEVLSGTYTLSCYPDLNANGRPDPGCPHPYVKPEIPILLDTKIDVRARWDTVLDEEYQITVEKP